MPLQRHKESYLGKTRELPYAYKADFTVQKGEGANEGDVELQVWSLGLEDPLVKACQPTSVFLPGESNGQRSPVDELQSTYLLFIYTF